MTHTEATISVNGGKEIDMNDIAAVAEELEEKLFHKTPQAPTKDKPKNTSAASTYPLIKLYGSDFKDRLKKLKPFMSTEETRYYLCGIFFQFKDSILTAAATNGHILQEQVFDVETELSKQYGKEFSVICPRAAIEHLIKIIPTKEEAAFTMQVIDDGANIRFDFFEFEYITATVDGTYPDYEKLIPKGTVSLQSGLNAGYLIAALAALGNTAVDICVDDKEKADQTPHLLTSSETKGIRCVIMPARID